MHDQIAGSSHNAPQMGQVAHLANGHRLDERIANRCCLVGADHHAAAGSIGRHLREKCILAAAANNVVDAADYIIWRNALAAAASGSGALLANDQTATASISAVPLVELALAASAAVPAFEPVAAVPAKETVFAAWSVEMFAPTRGTPSRRSALGEPLVVATSPQLELLLAALAESSTSLDVEPPAATSERTADSLFETLEPLELAFDWDDVAEASRGDEP